jgi:hypothetical protein
VTLAVVALVAAACGDDPDPVADGGLRAPVPVRAVGAGGQSGATAAAESDRLAGTGIAADAAIEPGMSIMPVFAGYEYVVGEGLGALPTNSTGYQYPPGAQAGEDQVRALAAALGVTGEPVRGGGMQVDGVQWRIGPDDGSAPTLVVIDDPQLSWYYSPAWLDDSVTSRECVAVADAGVAEAGGGADGSTGDATTSDVAPSEPAVSEPAPDAPDESGTSEAVEPPPVEECPEPEPPAGVPTAAEAESLARTFLSAIGVDPATVTFDVYADEWFATVDARPAFDGVAAPMSWYLGYGGGAELQWAGGALAAPVATGPYPLVDLDTALARLRDQQAMWGTIAIEPALVDPALVDPAVDPATGEPVPMPEPERIVATLVDVRPDLWWVWDEDGSIWLLPAYSFVDTEGGIHTVAAVTDEYLDIVEPTPEETVPVESVPVETVPVESVPVETVPVESVPVETVPVESVPVESVPAIDTDVYLGLTLDEATDLAARDGLTVRVVLLDGVGQDVTDDLRTDRLNVAVEAGVVVEVVSIG